LVIQNISPYALRFFIKGYRILGMMGNSQQINGSMVSEELHIGEFF
jgi:hypothetical protein